MRILTGVTAVLAALVLTGCGGRNAAPAPPTQFPPTDRQLLQSLLQRRSNALNRDRPRALASTAIPARRATELVAGRRAAGLGLVSAGYRLDDVDVRGRRARLRVELSYRVRGVTGDFGSPRTLHARRKDGEWHITRPQGSRGADPWEVDDYVRRQTPHFVVWTPRDIEAPISVLEAGYARLSAVLERGFLRRRYLVVVARDGEHASRLTQQIAEPESLLALADTRVGYAGPAQNVTVFASQRVIIVHSAFAAASPAVQRTVIPHELTHTTLAAIASRRVPGWLVEGVAMFVSEDDRRAEYRARASVPRLAALSAPSALARASGDDRDAAYATASAAAYTIAERYGRGRLLALYDAFRQPSLRGRRGDPRLAEHATRRVLGVGLEALQRSLG